MHKQCSDFTHPVLSCKCNSTSSWRKEARMPQSWVKIHAGSIMVCLMATWINEHIWSHEGMTFISIWFVSQSDLGPQNLCGNSRQKVYGQATGPLFNLYTRSGNEARAHMHTTARWKLFQNTLSAAKYMTGPHSNVVPTAYPLIWR